MISNRVMKLDETDGLEVWYRAGCACGGDECHLDLTLERHQDTPGYVELSLYRRMYYPCWPTGFWAKLRTRLRAALKILSGVSVRVDSEFLFDSKEQIEAFIEALREGINKLEEDRPCAKL